MASNEPHVLELGDDGRHAEWILYRLGKWQRLRLTVAPQLLHVPVRLYTNFPAEGATFIRPVYRELALYVTPGC